MLARNAALAKACTPASAPSSPRTSSPPRGGQTDRAVEVNGPGAVECRTPASHRVTVAVLGHDDVALKTQDRYVAVDEETARELVRHLEWLVEQAVAIHDGDPRAGGRIDSPGRPGTFVEVADCTDVPTLAFGIGGVTAVVSDVEAREAQSLLSACVTTLRSRAAPRRRRPVAGPARSA